MFSGGNGVIYGVKNDGTLDWYRHLGFEDGSDSWVNGGQGIPVGSGDQIFRLMFSGGYGVIYGVKNDGSLYWYNHLGFANGSKVWVNGGLPSSVGSGDQIFRLMFGGSI